MQDRMEGDEDRTGVTNRQTEKQMDGYMDGHTEGQTD